MDFPVNHTEGSVWVTFRGPGIIDSDEMDCSVGNGTSLRMTVTEDKTPTATYIGIGPPTYQELLELYPAKFTWQELKTFVNSGSVFRTCLPILPSNRRPQ